jgi:hypothetical protein
MEPDQGFGLTTILSWKKSIFLAAKLLATFVDQSSLFHSVSETAVIVKKLPMD